MRAELGCPRRFRLGRIDRGAHPSGESGPHRTKCFGSLLAGCDRVAIAHDEPPGLYAEAETYAQAAMPLLFDPAIMQNVQAPVVSALAKTLA